MTRARRAASRSEGCLAVGLRWGPSRRSAPAWRARAPSSGSDAAGVLPFAAERSSSAVSLAASRSSVVALGPAKPSGDERRPAWGRPLCHRGALLALLLLPAAAQAQAQAERLGGLRYRAVTLEPGQQKSFVLPGVEKLTGNSGECLEEGLMPDSLETLFIRALCPGVRTSLAWKADGTRLHILACSEGAERGAAVLALRKKVQAALKKEKAVTACVRGGHVELLGWAFSEAALARWVALARAHGAQVESHVELVEDDVP